MPGLRSWTAGAALVALVLTGAPGRAQSGANQGAGGAQTGTPASGQPAPESQVPVFRAGVNFVRVDVIVSDKSGNPVTDLKPDDFEIVEDKTLQKIDTFKLIWLDGGLLADADRPVRQIRTDTDEELEAARDDVRLFGIFLDDYHVRRESSIMAREQLVRFVETQLGPTDMVGVMYPLQPAAAVRMTRNHAEISRGLQQFVGRKYDFTPTNDQEQRYAYYPAETVEKIRNQVSMSAIKALIMRMGSLKEGRKALILVSEGYNAMLPPQMRDPVAAVPGFRNPAATDPSAGSTNTLAEERANFLGTSDLQNDLRDLWSVANRNNVAIYTVDPRGLAVSEFELEQNVNRGTDRAFLNATTETLRTLALNTDGRAIVGRNDLTVAMKNIVRDQSAYYLLGYNSTFTATDGKFHEIKVNVKRPGVQVRARKGYWAFTADDAARATAPPKPAMPTAYASALAAIASPTRGRVVRTWIGNERAADGKTRISFVWEPVPRTPGDRLSGEAPARVSLTAVGSDGAPYFRGRVPANAGVTPPSGGGASRVTFDAPPGKMLLRLSIEGATAEVLDTETREIDVPDLASPQTALGTPGVYRARTQREVLQIKNDRQAIPTAAREFSRAERVLVRFPVYGPEGAPPTVTARLLNRAAEPMNNLPVQPSAADPSMMEIELSLAPIPPGEYLLEIGVTGAGEPVKDVLGFRVAN
jgi:VWFA-related protein